MHQAVACLAQGGAVGLPSESTYGVVGGALHPAAIARLKSILGPENNHPPGVERLATLLLKGSGEVDDWAEVSTELGRRLTRRAWPGAVTLVFPASRRGLSTRLPAEVGPFLVPDGLIALRAPSNKMVREILRLLPCPLIQVDPPSTDGQWPTTADALADLHDLDMILDIGPTELGGPSTIVATSSPTAGRSPGPAWRPTTPWPGWRGRSYCLSAPGIPAGARWPRPFARRCWPEGSAA